MSEDLNRGGTFNRHYVRADENGLIVHGFSDAFEEPRPADALLADKGGRQFRLEHGGEENPPLFNETGAPLYRWDGKGAVPRTEDEIRADGARLPESAPPPSADERLEQMEKRVEYLCGAMEAIAETLPAPARAQIAQMRARALGEASDGQR